MRKQVIALKINGEEYETAVYPYRTLLEVLREDLGLTGVQRELWAGCLRGVYGNDRR